MIVKIEIDCCNDCPFSTACSRQAGLSTGNYYVLDWYCSKLEREITVTDFDEKVKIPKDCPFQELQD